MVCPQYHNNLSGTVPTKLGTIHDSFVTLNLGESYQIIKLNDMGI